MASLQRVVELGGWGGHGSVAHMLPVYVVPIRNEFKSSQSCKRCFYMHFLFGLPGCSSNKETNVVVQHINLME